MVTELSPQTYKIKGSLPSADNNINNEKNTQETTRSRSSCLVAFIMLVTLFPFDASSPPQPSIALQPGESPCANYDDDDDDDDENENAVDDDGFPLILRPS